MVPIIMIKRKLMVANNKCMIDRILELNELKDDSLFLWGARQTGKSTFLKQKYPDARYYDLLLPKEYQRLQRNPNLLIDELSLASEGELIIIDEIQELPMLLNAVQWLMVNRDLRFVLCGSSARKLKRVGANLLGGRALRRQMFPLVSAEIPDFNLIRAINNGMLPRHYLTENAQQRLQGYVGNYLKQEIEAEALSRNLDVFSRFLEAAALTDGEMVNYNNIATDCGISAKTVKEYFTVLQDTLLGYIIPAYTKVRQRRLIKAPKFYFFDVGIVNILVGRRNMQPGSADFGHAFEHFVIQEIVAWLGYSNSDRQLSYWRTASGYEVDAVISEPNGDIVVAIEMKAVSEVQLRHLHGLKALSEEHPRAEMIVVSLDARPRLFNGVKVLPALDFLKRLWDGNVM